MKTLLTILALVFITNSVKAQLSGQARIDSLLKELPKMKQDTNGVKLLSIIAFNFWNINTETGIEFGEKGLQLAENIGWELGKAICYNSLGVVYGYGKSDYPKALEFYSKALKINEELGDKSGIAANLVNIGIIFNYQSNYPKALEFYSKALKINEELGDENGIARNLMNMGSIYRSQLDFTKALEFYSKALKIDEALGNKNGVAAVLANMGIIYDYQSDYPKALEFYGTALKIFEELGDKNGVANNLGNMGGLYFILSQDTVVIKSSELNEYFSFNKEINLNNSIEYSLEAIKILEEVGELYNRSGYLKNLADAYKQKGEFKKWGEILEEHHKLKDSIFNVEKNEQLTTLEKAREDDLNRIKIEKQEIQLAAKEKEKNFIIYSGAGGIFSILIILGIIYTQRRKSEKLLLNILPAKIAKRLKSKEENISDDFENTTIIFIDLVGFTAFAKDKKASEVVKVLNKIFHRFDDLVKKNGLEKIKTMGDGYLAVAGVPEPDTNHCQKAVNFALEVRKEIEKFNNETGLNINARIGLETGPLVAGVIGSSKFIYDIWGDSVNTASRMESTGTPGKIQITENVKAELEKQSTNLQFEKREAFEVKGKGTMQTYFIEKKL